jgi:hypothetical protein
MYLGSIWAQAMRPYGFWLVLGANQDNDRDLGARDAKKQFWVVFGRRRCKKTVLGWFGLNLGAGDAKKRFWAGLG